ncbi:MAG: iron chelate uptake ABC transporter family permease subunit [Litoreibacter sp.]|uniref:iron chelate uptake ABC transporter family permease subunit n=1 Tax=Litoreibacter sp. TaxID=1969459 RepID=UPI0032998FF5
MARNRLLTLGVALVLCMLGYMTLGAQGGWGFILPFRGAKLAALLLVSLAIPTSTVLFQTITQNRILTPAIMGFDALYVLVVTTLVFTLGGQEYVRLPAMGQFALHVILLMIASFLLFGTLLGQMRQDVVRMILTGIIFGVLFRSITSFLQRMIDPNEYAMIQVSSYARFSRIETELPLIGAALTAVSMIFAWRMRHRLDVLELGHDVAINLGETPRRITLQALVIVAALVSVSTALVGPIVFLGLLVVSLAHLLVPAARHAVLVPCSILICGITLVGGQAVLERVLGLSTPLSVVIDLLGGVVFLALLLRRMAK